jgi:hypothetical protein
MSMIDTGKLAGYGNSSSPAARLSSGDDAGSELQRNEACDHGQACALSLKPAPKRNPMARAIAKPQYRPRIKPDKRRKIEAKRNKVSA